MKFYHRIVFLLGAIAWFLLLWYLPDYHVFSRRMALLLRFMAVAGAIFLGFMVFSKESD
ncbi:MAG: hypothetical protein JW884_10475 [Deltaproteobacteria bacterium]|nr:hypothetical protein [Deltaproteobacteria bacterium]